MRLPPTYKTDTPAPLLIPDAELITRMVDHGMPRKDAMQLTSNPGLRLMATRFYFDVADAVRGDKAAKERVDYCRHMWNERAKVEAQTKRETERTTISVPRSI